MDLQGLMRQAQEIRERMEKLQEELGTRTVEASAGGGMVTVVANGRLEVVSVRIDPEVVVPGEAGLLEDLVRGAVNEALARAREMAAGEMARLAGPFGLPGLP